MPNVENAKVDLDVSHQIVVEPHQHGPSMNARKSANPLTPHLMISSRSFNHKLDGVEEYNLR
ncbi:MAG: hypothetical protein ACK5PB_21950 [Pirellula sp.]|jgi:hypothetical protein